MLKTYNVDPEKGFFIDWTEVLKKHKKSEEKIVRNIDDGNINILYELRNHIVMGTASFPLSRNFNHVAFVRNVNSKNGKSTTNNDRQHARKNGEVTRRMEEDSTS